MWSRVGLDWDGLNWGRDLFDQKPCTHQEHDGEDGASILVMSLGILQRHVLGDGHVQVGDGVGDVVQAIQHGCVAGQGRRPVGVASGVGMMTAGLD